MEFLNQVFLDNTIRQYLITAGIILFAWLFKKFLGRYVAQLWIVVMRILGRKIQKKPFTDLIIEPTETFLVLQIAFLAIDQLKYPSQLHFSIFKKEGQWLLQGFAQAILIIAFFRMVLSIIDYMAMVMEEKARATADNTDNQMVIFFKDFFKVLAIIIGFLMVLGFAFEQNVTKLLAALSVGAAALALAARESLENLIASFIIFFDKPFMVGDVVKVQTIIGTIEKIGLRSTRIRTTEKTYVSVPNKQMVDSIVDNLSMRTERKAALNLELSLHTTTSQLQSLLEQVRDLLEDPMIVEKSVYLTDVTGQAIIVNVEYFTGPVPMADFSRKREEITMGVKQILEHMNIEIAGASTDIRLENA